MKHNIIPATQAQTITLGHMQSYSPGGTIGKGGEQSGTPGQIIYAD